jgi:hypothetical protein
MDIDDNRAPSRDSSSSSNQQQGSASQVSSSFTIKF